MAIITLTNDFHGSAVRVRVDHTGLLTPRQYKRADKVLCGISDCCCGGIHRDCSVEPATGRPERDGYRLLNRGDLPKEPAAQSVEEALERAAGRGDEAAQMALRDLRAE